MHRVCSSRGALNRFGGIHVWMGRKFGICEARRVRLADMSSHGKPFVPE